jgi:hypothetical protein
MRIFYGLFGRLVVFSLINSILGLSAESSRHVDIQIIPKSIDLTELNKSMLFLGSIFSCSTSDIAQQFSSRARIIDTAIARMLKEELSNRVNNNDKVTEKIQLVVALVETSLLAEKIGSDVVAAHKKIKHVLKEHQLIIPNASRALSLMSIANWLWKQSIKILTMGNELKKSLLKFTKDFPAQKLGDYVESPTLKNLLLDLQNAGNLDVFFTVWDAIQAYYSGGDKQKLISLFAIDFSNQVSSKKVPETVLKNFTGIVAAFVWYASQQVSSAVAEQKAIDLSNLYDIYNKINSLPIAGAIAALQDMIQQFSVLIHQVSSQNNFVSWGQWLKENWAAIPIVIVVCIVKIEQYFYPYDSSKLTMTECNQ